MAEEEIIDPGNLLDETEGFNEAEIEALEAQLAEGGEFAGETWAEEEQFEEEADVVAEAGLEVEDHLKDAVEGSLRLKRLLSRDEEPEPGKKRVRATDEEDVDKEAKIRALLMRWQCTPNDLVVKHVLESCSGEILAGLLNSNWYLDKFNMHKSPAELLARQVGNLAERSLPGGHVCDAVSAFKFRFKLSLADDKKIRALSHKDLRYVLCNFDGMQSIDEVIELAAAEEPVEDNAAANAFPEGPGVSTLGRFTRLELIDPLADCAVFGEANLTFALKLSKHRKALGHVGRVIATTFEELPTLRERYKEIDESIKILEDDLCEVWHGVDCTRIGLDPRFKGLEGSLGAVYYNYPHSGAIQGFFDGHPVVNWRHENLMRLFFRALRSFMKPGGFVKVASNCNAVGVRYSYIVGSAIQNEFIHIETVPFTQWHLHRYGRSYGDKRDVYKRPDATNNQSYNAQAAEKDMVYCFCYTPTGEALPRQDIKLPPTLKTLKACSDGPFKHLQGIGKDNLANQLHQRFVTEVSGVHVG